VTLLADSSGRTLSRRFIEIVKDTHDEILIRSARRAITKLDKHGRHHVGAALRARNGKVYCGVDLEASIGRIAVCAEAFALGLAVMDGESMIDTIVAVRHDGSVIPPCGMCREMISDYSPSASNSGRYPDGPRG